jgi:hypothetical protein
VALFTIDKLANQPRCPSTDEWIKKITHTHTYNVVIRKNEIMFSEKCMKLDIMLNKINQTQKDMSISCFSHK